MGSKGRAIIFEETETGCLVPTNMKLNQDGYFRKAWGSCRKNERVAEMFHRFIWRARKGEIPDEYEINHLCGNRACQNVDHMECIHGKEHAIKTNQERYADIKEAAKKHWLETRCTATELVNLFDRWSAYAWVREWKKDHVQ
jgi:hypothetical protein